MRELERLALVMRQIEQVEVERDAVVRDNREPVDAAGEPEREAAMIAVLNRLKGSE